MITLSAAAAGGGGRSSRGSRSPASSSSTSSSSLSSSSASSAAAATAAAAAAAAASPSPSPGGRRKKPCLSARYVALVANTNTTSTTSVVFLQAWYSYKRGICTWLQGEEREEDREQREGATEDARAQRGIPGKDKKKGLDVPGNFRLSPREIIYSSSRLRCILFFSISIGAHNRWIWLQDSLSFSSSNLLE